MGKPENILLKAATGLEGGLVASGSTCGVVSGGSLGLALALDEAVTAAGGRGEAALINMAGDYARWFAGTYGSTACKGRVGVDFRTLSGQVRYFVGPDKIAKCMSHIAGAFGWLDKAISGGLPKDLPKAWGADEPGIHCARAVLSGVRQRTGVSDPLLERLSYVYDGGVGLSGGACGALVGAVLSINLILGMDLRNVPYLKTLKPFLVGHKNVLTSPKPGKPEPFGVGKAVIDRFHETAGHTPCSIITGRSFSGWEDFASYRISGKCGDIINSATDAACAAIGAITAAGKAGFAEAS
ncbi:MAG: C_GCAxxG_C_C family protein [Deltaproteobacteria bacterium]|nr:C_GCAxxG_C_C family protein [Deltaproteobacteria bacterium]